MTRKDVHKQLTFDIVHRKRSLAGNAFICSRIRRYTNDMLMLAARGINGGTPVSKTERRKDHEEETIEREKKKKKRKKRAKEVAMHAGTPRSRLITVIMNAYGDADDEDDDKDDDDGNDTAAAVTLGSMARNTRDKLPDESHLFR